MFDIYDNGTPKYSAPYEIYEALCGMESGEEMGIISEMFGDVSWENQDYYYTDAASKLKERWDRLVGYDGDWIMALAVYQIDGGEIHDLVYQMLRNDDMAKRVGFKKIFVDELLAGIKNRYEEATEYFEAELSELSRFDYSEMCRLWAVAYEKVAPGAWLYNNPYGNFANAIYKKVMGLKLEEEKQLIVECRAMLNAYDDFMFGLKSNQHLYNALEQSYQNKVAQLQEAYEQKIAQLMAAAEKTGLLEEVLKEMKMLQEVSNENH